MSENVRFFFFDLSQGPVDSVIYVNANTIQIEVDGPGSLPSPGWLQADNNARIPITDAFTLNLGFVQDLRRLHIRFPFAPGFSVVVTISTAAKVVVA
ncbi:MAG: hypothetical protein NUW37_07725 [Planctomycetes bacterium]|nr:hypothetical protein [Planctomycetota bacterium]